MESYQEEPVLMSGDRSRGLFDIVSDVLRDVAPDELPILAALHGQDDANIFRLLKKRGAADEPLGFGIGDTALLVTPIIWAALQHAVNSLTDKAVDSLGGQLKRIFRRHVPQNNNTDLTKLTDAQLSDLRDTFVALAIREGMERERAEEIGTQLVQRLNLDRGNP